MRRAAKRDMNEASIVQALEAIGVQVFRVSQPGHADLLTYRAGVWLPVEVKMPGEDLTTAQVAMRATAPYPVVETVAQALALFQVHVRFKPGDQPWLARRGQEGADTP
jgi:hypothetical protein